MRKLFIILVGLIAIVTFIRAFDNLSSLNINIPAEDSGGTNTEVFPSDENSSLLEP